MLLSCLLKSIKLHLYLITLQSLFFVRNCDSKISLYYLVVINRCVIINTSFFFQAEAKNNVDVTLKTISCQYS